jgi:3-oxoacyl-[acyl-carrier protein] reductase
MTFPDLSGQTALITGGGRGIGRAVAEMLAQAGAAVVVSARSADEVNAVVHHLHATGGDALGVVADVAVPEDISRLVDAAVEMYGTVNILVNNAGVIQPIGMVWEVDPEEWARGITVNLVGAFRLCHAVLPLMIEEGAGRIINVSSGAARGVTLGWSAYASAKAGLDHFTRILAGECQPHGVCVNAVHPGSTNTRMQSDIRGVPDRQMPAVGRFRQMHTLGNLRDPREPAELILWLCTSAARDVNGAILDIADPDLRERIARDLGRPLLPGPERPRPA